MVDISIIIVNYNTLDVTNECIKSIENHTEGINYEIILIDNASSDGSKAFFQNRAGINYIWSDANLGFGKANNIGYKYSSGRYLLFLNSDTLLQNNALERFLFAADNEEDKNVGCWGAMLIGKDGQLAHSYGPFPTLLTDLVKELFLIPVSKLTKRNVGLQKGRTLPTKYVDYIIGADLLIRRDIIEQYGLFNPKFFMYYEDAELLWRYRQAGIMAKIIDGPLIMHLEGGSAKRPKRKSLARSIMQLKSKLTYFSLTQPRLRFLMYKSLLLIIRIPFLVFSRYTLKEKRLYFKTIIEG